jgi:hypothetical protein
MFTYVRIVVVLIYFIDEDRIDQFEGEIQSSDWLELSEKQCARTTPKLAAAERIINVMSNLPGRPLQDSKVVFCVHDLMCETGALPTSSGPKAR